MLRRNRRITNRQRVQSVLKEGDRLKGRSLVMLYKENELDHHCYGVIVSKKVHKSAVKRNRIRRQIYESIRLLEQDGIVPSGSSSDIVLLARRSTLELDFTAIKAEVQTLFTKES